MRIFGNLSGLLLIAVGAVLYKEYRDATQSGGHSKDSGD